MAESEEIKADIDRTRAELAETVGALAGKLDPKQQAAKHAHEAKAQLGARYSELRESAPPPVQHTLDSVQHAAAPVVAKARANRRQTAMIAGGAFLTLVVVRRVRRRRRGRG